jgi:hypothetical protein
LGLTWLEAATSQMKDVAVSGIRLKRFRKNDALLQALVILQSCMKVM